MVPKLLSLGYLKSTKSEETTPFELEIPGREPFFCEEIFRHLPGKRLVFLSRWGGTEVLVKLFFQRKDFETEQAGLDAMHRAGVLCPKKIWCMVDTEQGYFIATEFLSEASTLQDCYQSLSKKQFLPLLCDAVKLIAMLHRNDLMQEDIHFSNLMVRQEKIYMIDGGGIKKLSTPIANLSLFFAQMTPDYDHMAHSVVDSYNSDLPLTEDLLPAIRDMREIRIKRYLAKTLRSCTKFRIFKTRYFFAVAERSFLTKNLRQLIDEPEVAIGQAKFIKRGNSATVLKIAADECNWVIKRYNIKNFWHRLSRCWRPSRAYVSWQAAHRLALLGISTPRPIAMRENRNGPFRREAYLITEFLDGKDLHAWLLTSKDDKIPNWLGQAVLHLFDTLWHSRVSHGDMKSTNFMISGKTFHVIDLDAMKLHKSENSLKEALSKDLQRFMSNWQGSTWIYFEKLLRPFSEKLNITLTNKKV